ncbi:MAG TPA: hypothetical protein VGP21_07110, partial [Opitutaceae bacterium]|nr:hypothetical protein [Opitutaceae bacterium]
QIAVRGKWFLAEGWQVYSLVFFALGAALHLGGLWLLAPHFGALGAAGSFLFAQFGMVILAPLFFARTRRAAKLALRSFFQVKN